MDQPENLNKVKIILDLLNDQGLIYESLLRPVSKNNIDILVSNLLEEEIEDLDLISSLILQLEYKLKDRVNLNELISDTNPFTFDIKLKFLSLYNESGIFDVVEETSWPKVLGLVKEEGELLKGLKKHLSLYDLENPDSAGKTCRNNRSPILGLTFGQLYGQQVRAKRLKYFIENGDKFPYVAINSSSLGDLGRSEGGLYFVATDLANESWKEQIAIYHERFCQPKGHEFAKIKELELARKFDKEREWLEFREFTKHLF